MLNPRIEELARRDPRYAPEAYEFVYDALSFAARRIHKAPDDEHVSVADFLRGACELAVRDFGLMAGAVFRAWGVRRTDDFGDIVFHLIGAGLLDPTAADDRAAFHDRFDLQNGLTAGYHIEAGEGPGGPVMKFAVVRLAVAAALFLAWIGYLSYLAATTRNPVVLSRPQFLVSERDVIAVYKGGDNFVIDEVLYPKDEPGAEKGKTLVVDNVKDCQTFSPENGWRVGGLVEGQRYLMPLQSSAASKDVMDVVPIPPSPGYPPLSNGAGPPRVYPDTPEVRRQYQTIEAEGEPEASATGDAVQRLHASSGR